MEEYQSIGFKGYLDSKFEEFTKEINNINKKSISNFFKLLEADGLYHFEVCSSNEKLNEPLAPIKLPELLNEEVLASFQNFLDAERGFSSRSRSNLLSEEKTETESLRRANSLSILSVENSNIKPIESSTSSLESLENESPKLCNDQLAQAIQSVFFKENKTLLNINKHGLALQKELFQWSRKI